MSLVDLPVTSVMVDPVLLEYALNGLLASAQAAQVVPAVATVAAESAGLITVSTVLSVVAPVVATVVVVGAVIGALDLFLDLKRDGVDMRKEHSLFYVTNAENLTLADMNVLKGMHARWYTGECCNATFTNYEVGWNRTGTMERNEDHVKFGVHHGQFTIHMDDETKIDPQGLWIHLGNNGTTKQSEDQEVPLEHGEAHKRLSDIFEKLVNVSNAKQESDD